VSLNIKQSPKPFIAQLIGYSILLIMSNTVLAENSTKITASYDYTSGKYGSDVTTEIEYIPVTIQRIKGAWSTSLTVPYISITGNGTTIPGTGPVVQSGSSGNGFYGPVSSSKTVTNAGLGDIIASVGYAMGNSNGAFYELIGKVKFATADNAKGLGSGENDFSLQLDGFFGKSKNRPFFTLGYIVTGDSTQFAYNDVFFGTLGMMFKKDRTSDVGLAYDYRQASIDGTDDQHKVSAFITTKHSKLWISTLSGLIGLTDSSPDFGISLTLRKLY